MLVADFEIIITKPFPAALIPSPFRFYGDIYKLVYTTSLCGATVSATSRKPAYKYWNYSPQSLVYKWTCVAYTNKLQNRLIALVIKCVISHIDCIWNESVNGSGWVWTDFVIQISGALGLGMTKCSISRNRLNDFVRLHMKIILYIPLFV